MAVLVNHGEIRSSVGAGGPRTLVASVDNEGLIQIDQGLQINQGSGTTDLTSGSAVLNGGLTITNGTTVLKPSTLSGPGTLDINSGTVQLTEDFVIPAGTSRLALSGSSTVQGPGSS